MKKRQFNASDAISNVPVSIAILDNAGNIAAVNSLWREFARRNGLKLANAGIGRNYLQYCLPATAKALKSLLAGKRRLVMQFYPCHSPRRERWFLYVGLPLALERQGGVVLLHIQLTDLLTHLFNLGAHHNKGIEKNSLEAFGSALEYAAASALASHLSKMLTGIGKQSVRANRNSKTAAATPSAVSGLTGRQKEILRLLGEGKTNKEIARTLLRSPNTIKLHVSAILDKLDLKSRTQAALLASQIVGAHEPSV
jgi:DNA-binding CsgD family transcriptional regulator